MGLLKSLGSLFSCIWFKFFQTLFWSINQIVYSRRTVKPVDQSLLLQSATSLAKKIRNGELKSEEVVEAFIQRSEEVNRDLNCVVRKNFDAIRSAARKVDKSVSDGSAPSIHEAPFLGVPFTLKDCIFVRGLKCTAGVPARSGTGPAEESAECVENLRAAGAIGPLVVTNVSEVCMWWESNNGIYGRSNNPYDTRCIVGGSSGGEGALLSSGGSPFGIGSDIGGSIRMPAFFNGIFGHKPSKFVLSDKGTYPPVTEYQCTMHSVGPMSRFAEDLEPMFKALGGPNISSQLKLNEPVDVTELKYYYMEGLEPRIPIVTPLHESMRHALKKVVKYLSRRHEIVAHRVDLELMKMALPIWFNDMETESGPSFKQEMADRVGQVNPYKEMVKLLLRRSPHTLPALSLAIFEDLFATPKEARKKLEAMREHLRRDLEDLLGKDGVLLFPSHPTPAPFHNQPIAQPFNWIYTGIFNSLGVPVTQVPLGLSDQGLPVGIQVVAAAYNDRLCLAVARDLEKAFGGWVNPGTR